MKQIEYVIKDENGIHARPAGNLVAKLNEFKSKITFKCGDRSAEGKKLFALMKMRVKKGETLVVEAEGEDEDAVVTAAKEFLEANL
ncbi:MAG: HPr family phosphocarrier protein [Spirochaetaceae bacterium]|jgi:phosphocarrier protein|nr:HPr family phosphocarrier protein [Spirochaetaceae bacterium]